MQSIFDVSVFYLDIFFTVKFETKLLTYNGLFFFFFFLRYFFLKFLKLIIQCKCIKTCFVYLKGVIAVLIITFRTGHSR